MNTKRNDAPTDHEFTSEEIDGYIAKILKKPGYVYGITLR